MEDEVICKDMMYLGRNSVEYAVCCECGLTVRGAAVLLGDGISREVYVCHEVCYRQLMAMGIPLLYRCQ